MIVLFFSELSYYTTIETVDRLIVNSTHSEHLKVTFRISFPHIACDLLSLDAMDQSGQKQEGVTHHIFKQKLDPKVPKHQVRPSPLFVPLSLCPSGLSSAP